MVFAMANFEPSNHMHPPSAKSLDRVSQCVMMMSLKFTTIGGILLAHFR